MQESFEMQPINYRPVSLTSVCCKVLERVIVSQVVAYLESNGLLSVNQVGFRKGKSVEDQFLVTYGKVVELTDRGFVVDIIFLNFFKAFDVVYRSIMLAKLRMWSIGGKPLSWIRDFLSGRTISVKVADKMSSLKVTSGVSSWASVGSHVVFNLCKLHCKLSSASMESLC